MENNIMYHVILNLDFKLFEKISMSSHKNHRLEGGIFWVQNLCNSERFLKYFLKISLTLQKGIKMICILSLRYLQILEPKKPWKSLSHQQKRATEEKNLYRSMLPLESDVTLIYGTVGTCKHQTKYFLHEQGENRRTFHCV